MSLLEDYEDLAEMGESEEEPGPLRSESLGHPIGHKRNDIPTPLLGWREEFAEITSPLVLAKDGRTAQWGTAQSSVQFLYGALTSVCVWVLAVRKGMKGMVEKLLAAGAKAESTDEVKEREPCTQSRWRHWCACCQHP